MERNVVVPLRLAFVVGGSARLDRSWSTGAFRFKWRVKEIKINPAILSAHRGRITLGQVVDFS